ncbi:hypothetical protein PV336_16230 [Streptomyces sp. MI02-2A]|uniref:hypothetical protein n=1 Tax=Streptomyces sp. MI02-2A TaxID=3028688 RepID=UPI0029ABDABB|nr:hypothetical protein [Streptomyces sp. MI02-2A]MDX3260769.1 hypothetical protein [Streptomyces sp. MI02-2A]
MSEPMYVVALTRRQVMNLVRDAEYAKFPNLETSEETGLFFAELKGWWRENRYAAQLRAKGAAWKTLGATEGPAGAAHLLGDEMQRHGFRFSELSAHREDLVAGHILTADDGYEFRVVIDANAENAQ